MKKGMKLSLEQITYIDDYLKHHKVKYWDIRIELLDHIVTTVEEKLTKGISFDDAMIEVHKSFGNKMTMFWNSGIEYGIFANGLGYKNLIQDKRIEINNKYRKLVNKEIISFFKSFKKVSVLLVLFILEFLISINTSSATFKTINIILFHIPILVFIGYSFRKYMMKRKSIHMQYSMSSVIILFLILQITFQFINPEGIFKVSEQTQAIILIIVIPLNFVFIYCGFEVYRKAEKFYLQVYNQLQSL
jgi:hypothetical protein